MDKAEYSPELFLQQIKKMAEIHGVNFPGGFEKKIGMRGAVSSWEHLDKKGFPRKYSIPSVDTLLKIKNLFKVSVDWLLTGKEPKSREMLQPIIQVAGHYSELPPGVISDNFMAVPIVEDRIAAKYGRFIPPSEIKRMICVYLPHESPRWKHNLLAIQVESNYHKMEPTIRAGDIVIIDPHDILLAPNAIYAVRSHRGSSFTIKRVYKNDKSLVIISDNPDSIPYTLPSDDIEKVLVGRVLCSWRDLIR